MGTCGDGNNIGSSIEDVKSLLKRETMSKIQTP
jgi:hypothetical protein